MFMRKLANPFGGNKTVYITQTYHSGGGNIAIDCITDGTNSQTPVYAISDGTVVAATPAGNSYLCKTVDGANFQEFYVHTARWTVNIGDHVRAGDQIGYIATSQENGGFPMHLHMGLTTGNYIMNYFDRGINFRTTYQDIANDWFNGSTNNPIDWSLFQDLSLDGGNMFSVGDRIIFTGEQNIRVGSGLQYEVESSSYAGMKATIIEGSRFVDGYTWYNIQVDGGGTGWVADVDKFVLLTDENNNSGNDNVPPVEDDNKKLKEEIEKLRKDLRGAVAQLQVGEVLCREYREANDELAEDNKKLEKELTTLKKKLKDTEEKLSSVHSIDEYSTTELLREIVKRIFSPNNN